MDVEDLVRTHLSVLVVDGRLELRPVRPKLGHLHRGVIDAAGFDRTRKCAHLVPNEGLVPLVQALGTR